MAKKFAPRVSKRKRKTVQMGDGLGTDAFKLSDEKLLKGAMLSEMFLKDITVKEQVRTKFNDVSLKDLAENIKANGLIQPLVVHFKDKVHTLICGERRYRAMSLIEMEKCPCIILQNKTEEELMAIQFSENSSREGLHYVDRADGILNYQQATRASERKITADLGISKSEVHRSLIIARIPSNIKEAAKAFNIEKYVLLEFHALDDSETKRGIEEKILAGAIKKRSELKRAIGGGDVSTSKPRARRRPSVPKGMSANVFIKAMSSRAKNMDLDPATKKKFDALLRETQDLMDV